MKQNREPVYCPGCGSEMQMYQIAAGGYRYGCRKCATSFKDMKKPSYGWISPIKSTKERAWAAARNAAIVRKKPLTWPEMCARRLDVIYMEKRQRAFVAPLFVIKTDEFFSRFRGVDGRTTIESRSRMNIEWRCWATKPSDQERTAAKWEDKK